MTTSAPSNPTSQHISLHISGESGKTASGSKCLTPNQMKYAGGTLLVLAAVALTGVIAVSTQQRRTHAMQLAATALGVMTGVLGTVGCITWSIGKTSR